jgi:hypothetical protein
MSNALLPFHRRPFEDIDADNSDVMGVIVEQIQEIAHTSNRWL